MAFFAGKNKSNYFGIYYYVESNDTITGAFHELSDKQSRFFAACYRMAAVIATLGFLFDALFFTLARFGGVAWCADAWKFFLLATPVPLVLLALYIVWKPKLAIVREELAIDKSPSIAVYATVISTLLAMVLNILWMNLVGERIPGGYLWMAFFVFLSLVAATRVAIVMKM